MQGSSQEISLGEAFDVSSDPQSVQAHVLIGKPKLMRAGCGKEAAATRAARLLRAIVGLLPIVGLRTIPRAWQQDRGNSSNDAPMKASDS